MLLLSTFFSFLEVREHVANGTTLDFSTGLRSKISIPI